MLIHAETADRCELLPEAVRTSGTRIRIVEDDIVSLYRAFRIVCILAAAVARASSSSRLGDRPEISNA